MSPDGDRARLRLARGRSVSSQCISAQISSTLGKGTTTFCEDMREETRFSRPWKASRRSVTPTTYDGGRR